MIVDLLWRDELLIKSQPTEDVVCLLSSSTFDIHSKPNLFLEIRQYENDIIDEALKLSPRLLELLRNEIHRVSLVLPDIVQLRLFINFGRYVDPIGLEFSHEVIEELHMRPLVVHKRYRAILGIALQ